MGTKIKDPKANNPVSGRGSSTTTGAAAGAVAGTAVMPGVGTVVGAVIGAAWGFLGGSEQDKSAKHATLASKYARLRQERQAAVARRDIVRQFRMARASAMTIVGNESGGTRSSAPQGAVSSLGTQFGFNTAFFDADVYLQQQFQKHSTKAGKHAAAANMINSSLMATASAVGAMGSAFSFGSASRGYSGLSNETLSSTNSLGTPMKQDFGWIKPPSYTI